MHITNCVYSYSPKFKLKLPILILCKKAAAHKNNNQNIYLILIQAVICGAWKQWLMLIDPWVPQRKD